MSPTTTTNHIGGIDKLREAMPPMDGNLMGPAMVTPWQPLGIAQRIIQTFTAPTSAAKSSPTTPKLISITSSVYAEKVRFALDLMLATDKPVFSHYVEDIHPPALHCGFALAETRNQQSRTPLLVITDANGQTSTLLSSEEILPQVCPHLYPNKIAKEIKQLEHEWGHSLGAAVRSIYYVHLLLLQQPGNHQYYPAMTRLCTGAVPQVSATLFRAMLDKGVDQGMCECLGLSVDSNAAAEQVLEATLTQLSKLVDEKKLLQDETAYWMDTPQNKYGFTAADLALAVYVANACGDVPALDGLSTNVLRDDDALPPALLALRQRWRATSVAAYARRIYRQHRPVGPNGRITIRAARRDQTPWAALGALTAVGMALTTAALWRRRGA